MKSIFLNKVRKKDQQKTLGPVISSDFHWEAEPDSTLSVFTTVRNVRMIFPSGSFAQTFFSLPPSFLFFKFANTCRCVASNHQLVAGGGKSGGRSVNRWFGKLLISMRSLYFRS